MTGGYLRTNYRRSTGMARIDGIGGAIPQSSQVGGAGTTDPYGGFIWLSWTGNIMQATAAASLAGISSRWVESTYGLMGSFYGAGAFTSGYAFLPVVAYAMSLSGEVMSAGETTAEHLAGGYWVGSFRHSGSYAIFTPLNLTASTANDKTYCSLSGATADFQIGGFIISTP